MAIIDLRSILDNAGDLLKEGVEGVQGKVDELGDFLDFGFGDPQIAEEEAAINRQLNQGPHAGDPAIWRSDTQPPNQSPELDLRAVETANPTNTNFPNPLASTNVLVIGAGVIGVFLILKATKVI